MIVIPAIDIMNGRCVRLVQGRFDQCMTYDADPLDTARSFEAAGITHLHLVDLDGARRGRPANLHILETLAKETTLRIDFGGGIRSIPAIRQALEAGAAQVNLGTFLFSGPEVPRRCIEAFGADALIAAVDIDHGQAAIKGWQQSSGLDAATVIENLLENGWRYFSITDISRDGTLKGPDPDLYKPLAAKYASARFIGGGGVASIEHVMMLKSCGLYAAITGKALFEGRISLEDLAKLNTQQ